MYEPGSFTPLLQVFEASAAHASGQQQPSNAELPEEIQQQVQAYEEACEEIHAQFKQLENLIPPGQLRELKQQAQRQIDLGYVSER